MRRRGERVARSASRDSPPHPDSPYRASTLLRTANLLGMCLVVPERERGRLGGIQNHRAVASNDPESSRATPDSRGCRGGS